MELYSERGFEQTTVAEIAERAGLTERTFFRHFADKREVLFAGADALQELVVSAVAGAPESAAPIDAAVAGVQAAAALLQEGHEYSRLRQAIIIASAELRERELIKLASLAVVIADAELTAGRLAGVVDALLADPARLQAMADASSGLARPHAAQDIAAELLAAAS